MYKARVEGAAKRQSQLVFTHSCGLGGIAYVVDDIFVSGTSHPVLVCKSAMENILKY